MPCLGVWQTVRRICQQNVTSKPGQSRVCAPAAPQFKHLYASRHIRQAFVCQPLRQTTDCMQTTNKKLIFARIVCLLFTMPMVKSGLYTAGSYQANLVKATLRAKNCSYTFSKR